MKAIFCTLCMDIRALDPEGEWTDCRCGNLTAKWLDANRGTVTVQAKNREAARIIGLNNRMLTAAAKGNHDNECWQKMHDEATNAAGYIFDKAMRNCWACILRVGETGDITWAD